MSDRGEADEYPAEVWAQYLLYAESDFCSSELVFGASGVRWHEPCFLARESAEKALKAFLDAAGREIPALHSLRALGRECASVDREFRRFERHYEVLNRYQSAARYPPVEEYEFTREIAAEAIQLAREIVETVRARIELRQRKGLL